MSTIYLLCKERSPEPYSNEDFEPYDVPESAHSSREKALQTLVDLAESMTSGRRNTYTVVENGHHIVFRCSDNGSNATLYSQIYHILEVPFDA